MEMLVLLILSLDVILPEPVPTSLRIVTMVTLVLLILVIRILEYAVMYLFLVMMDVVVPLIHVMLKKDVSTL
jgi:hypothetical protein